MKPISQGPFLRGLQAGNQILAQPKGSLARISNFCYRKRGALSTIDGSEIINWFGGTLQGSTGMIEGISLFQPINVARYFMILKDALDLQLQTPSGLVASTTTGGSLVSGTTYYYEVTALDGVGGETTVSNEASATPSGIYLSIILTWNPVPSAAYYNVYRSTSPGAEKLLVGTGLPVQTNTWTDTGAIAATGTVTYNLLASPLGCVATSFAHPNGTTYQFTTSTTPSAVSNGTSFSISGASPSLFDGGWICTLVTGNTVYVKQFGAQNNATGGGGTLSVGGTGGISPPLTNTTQQMALFKLPNVGNYPIAYSNTDIVALFPPAPIPIAGGEPAGSGGSGGIGGGGIVGGSSPTPLGGIIGTTCTLPQFAQFNNQLFLALGNGFPPQIYTDVNSIPTNVTYIQVSTISTIVENSGGTQATITTTTPHLLTIGSQVLLAGVANPIFNGGPFTVVSITSTTIFVVALIATGSASSSGGTVTPTTIPVFNTFIPAYPIWIASTQFALNSVVIPTGSGPQTITSVQESLLGNQATFTATAHGFSVGQVVNITGVSNAAFNGVFTITHVTTNTFNVKNAVANGGVSATGGVATPIGNVYYFAAIQGGISGSTQPIWPTTIGGQVSDGGVIWQNKGLTASGAPAPPGAAHAIVYAGSLWIANTWPVDHPNGIDGPSALRMSDTNAPNSWNPINQAFLDKDDGTEIQGMATFTITAQGIPPEGSLVVFKDFATYQIVGVFGASNFSIQRVVTDLGCTAPRTIQFVPGFGIARLTHLGFAVFNGVEDKVISEEIRPYLFPSNDVNVADIVPIDQNYSYGSYGFQTASPPMYCCVCPIGNSGGQLTRVFCYDLVTKAWTIVDLPFALGSTAQVRAEGTIPIAMFGGFLDGALQRWQAGDIQWYTGASSGSRPYQSTVGWSFRSQEMASQVPDQRLYFRRVAIRGINTNSTTGVKVIPTVNGVAGNVYMSPTLPIGDFEIFAPIAMTGVRAHVDVSGSGDVEVQSISYHVEIKPAGAPTVIS